jgi:hypothetical protein
MPRLEGGGITFHCLHQEEDFPLLGSDFDVSN